MHSLSTPAEHRTSRPPFHHVGILYHPKKPESRQLAEEMGAYLASVGMTDIWLESAWDQDATTAHLPEADLLVTLGGDGTLLRAARMGAEHEVPMLGVKMGRLGFLAEVQPHDWQTPLDRVLAGDYWIEQRLMIRVHVERHDPDSGDAAHTCVYDALNDVVLSRGNLARVVRISAELDNSYLTTYTCDGLIISTATGSTGYALAVNGPIMPPELRNILVIPIAPHLSMDRAVILAEGATIRLRAHGDYPPMLTVDGQVVVEVEERDEVVVVGSPHLARFIRLRERGYFYQSLMEKMQWTI